MHRTALLGKQGKAAGVLRLASSCSRAQLVTMQELCDLVTCWWLETWQRWPFLCTAIGNQYISGLPFRKEMVVKHLTNTSGYQRIGKVAKTHPKAWENSISPPRNIRPLTGGKLVHKLTGKKNLKILITSSVPITVRELELF